MTVSLISFLPRARMSSSPSIVRHADPVGAGAVESMGGGIVSAPSWAVSGLLVALTGVAPILLVDAARAAP